MVLRHGRRSEEASLEAAHVEGVGPLGHGYLTVRSRERITVDGGFSVLAVDSLKVRSVSASDNNFVSSSPKLVAKRRKGSRPQSQQAMHDE